MSKYKITGSINTPLGEKSWTADKTLSGLEDTALSAVLALHGGEVDATTTVTEPTPGTFEIKGSFDVPIVGSIPFTLDEHLTGTADVAADEILKLDGGQIKAQVEVTKLPA